MVKGYTTNMAAILTLLFIEFMLDTTQNLIYDENVKD